MPHPETPTLTVHDLKTLLDRGEQPFLLDVRRPDEHAFVDLGGHLIPLQELPDRIEELDAHRGDRIVVYCRSGARSERAVQFLQAQGFEGATNLQGGILAWAREIDPSFPSY